MNVDPAQVEALKEAPSKLFQTIGEYNLPGGFVFSPSYIQAGLIVFCIFLLILTFGMLQHRFNHWTIKGVMPGVALGFMLAILLEAIFLIGGKTVITEVLGWKNAPKPVSNVLEASRNSLVDVLGSEAPSAEGLMSEYKNLSEEDQKSLVYFLCE